MKRKIIAMLLALVLTAGVLFSLAACGSNPDSGTPDGDGEGQVPGGDNTPGDGDGDGDNTPVTHNHVDLNKDGICDKCGEQMEVDSSDDRWTDVPWTSTPLLFQMTKCSNSEELPSGCERYLAGEDETATSNIDDKVRLRNARACVATNVSVSYVYYPDTTNYNWSKNIELMYTTVTSGATDTPDMFCNFLTDMLATSLKGSFANLYSTERGTGTTRGINYFDFDHPGYMKDLQRSMTLSKFKMYVLASDYFLDLIRAFFVVPVNIALFESLADGVVEDVNADGKTDIDDFFQEVLNGDWTYEKLAYYSNAVYERGGTATDGSASLQDTIGFALSSSSGLSACGMVYTSSVVIIHREWNETRNDYDYYYPQENEDLYHLTEALDTLFNSTGVISVLDSETYGYGSTSLIAIRNRFAANKVLFGGVILVGSLEYPEYQAMRDSRGFAVAPVPVYQEGDKYLTQVHAVGRGGGIATSTTKFAQCTAFIQYQSENSTDILNEYYDYKLSYDVADGLDGNVTMLQYIRSNVRTSFDKLFEDAIGFFFQTVDENSVSNRWHSLISTARYRMKNMREKYAELYGVKEHYLESLVQEYDKLPN